MVADIFIAFMCQLQKYWQVLSIGSAIFLMLAVKKKYRVMIVINLSHGCKFCALPEHTGVSGD
jgi:hypothetical protein